MARKKANQTPKIKEAVTMRDGKITQAILKLYLSNNLKLHKAKAIKSAIRDMLLPLLLNGSGVEAGPISAVIKPVDKLNVDWRAQYVKAMGEASAQKIERKAKTRTEHHLIVE